MSAERLFRYLFAMAWGALPALVVLGYAVKDPLLPRQVKATVENKVRWNRW